MATEGPRIQMHMKYSKNTIETKTNLLSSLHTYDHVKYLSNFILTMFFLTLSIIIEMKKLALRF